MWWTLVPVIFIFVFASVAAIRDYRVKRQLDKVDSFLNTTNKKLEFYIAYTERKDKSCTLLVETIKYLTDAYKTIPTIVDQLPNRHYKAACARMRKRASQLRDSIGKTLNLD